MLGSIIHSRGWNWAAVGKHPSAKDYIRFGGASPLLDAVAEWSANGYQQLNGDKTRQLAHRSWRFWLKGIKKGTLICGLGRDSSDSIGRPYPLLIMGEGTIKGWEKQWNTLPVRLDKTWTRMEFVAANRFDGAHAMEEAVNGLNTPHANSDPAAETGQQEQDGCFDLDLARCREQLRLEGLVMIGLNPKNRADPNELVRQCHRRLSDCCGEIPTGVFIGGTPQQAYLVVIQHPLSVQDFVQLWTC